MPTYAYACKDCGHAFDIQQSFTDDSLTVCPECRGNLRKKFNSVGVVFKGSGFYRTDSRSAANSIPAASAAGASDSASASSDSPAPAKSSESSSTSSGKSGSGNSASGTKAAKSPASAGVSS
ncbi:MAG: FmdB family zinc ribbon protein [Specibacter sp.]